MAPMCSFCWQDLSLTATSARSDGVTMNKCRQLITIQQSEFSDDKNIVKTFMSLVVCDRSLTRGIRWFGEVPWHQPKSINQSIIQSSHHGLHLCPFLHVIQLHICIHLIDITDHRTSFLCQLCSRVVRDIDQVDADVQLDNVQKSEICCRHKTTARTTAIH